MNAKQQQYQDKYSNFVDDYSPVIDYSEVDLTDLGYDLVMFNKPIPSDALSHHLHFILEGMNRAQQDMDNYQVPKGFDNEPF